MSVRELPEELKAKAKAELNEDPARIKDDLEHIKEWLKKQPHINARTDDQWLLCFLRGCKFSLERTKEKLDTFYTMRTMIPEFFKDRDPRRPEIQAALKKGIFLVLKNKKDLLAPTVVLFRGGAYNPSEINVTDVVKTNMMLMEINMLENDSLLVNGLRIIQDMNDVTLGHMSSPVVSKKAMMCFQDAFPNRVKTMEFFNIPSFFDTMFSIIRPFLNQKIKSRVKIHGAADLDSFYKDIPMEILPKEYGGDGESIEEITKALMDKMEKYRDWFLEDAKYGTDEKKRPGKPKTADELFGIEGSFRKLAVD